MPGVGPAGREADATRPGSSHDRLTRASCSTALPLLGWRCLQRRRRGGPECSKFRGVTQPSAVGKWTVDGSAHRLRWAEPCSAGRDGASHRIDRASWMRGEIDPGAGTARCAAAARRLVPPQRPPRGSCGGTHRGRQFGDGRRTCAARQGDHSKHMRVRRPPRAHEAQHKGPRSRRGLRRRRNLEQLTGSSAHVWQRLPSGAPNGVARRAGADLV